MKLTKWEERFEQIEDLLAEAATGDFNSLTLIDVEHDDALAAIETGVNIMLQDLGDLFTQNAMQAGQMRQQQQELEARVELIQRQAEAIHELSTPILQIWESVLVMPIIGIVDTKRSSEIMERMLSEIVAKQAHYIIMDITGVEIIDTKTADHFIKMMKAAELLGASCIVTGIRPAVAQTLVEIGIDLPSVITMSNLKEGLRECMRKINKTNK